MVKEQNTQAEDGTRKPVCGIVMPISAIDGCAKEHWSEVEGILTGAIVEAGFDACLVSNADDSGVIQKRIVQNLYNNAMVVCDVSCKNPNVMFELGMRLAFDKPTVVVMDDKTDFSFDTAPIEHLIYPRDLSYYRILEFRKKLSDKIAGTAAAAKEEGYTTFLKHFGEFEVASIKNRKGSVDEAIMACLEELSAQVDALGRCRHTDFVSRIENSCRQTQIDTIVREQIECYCRENGVKEEELSDMEDCGERWNALCRYVSADRNVRYLCGSPMEVRRAIARNLRGGMLRD